SNSGCCEYCSFIGRSESFFSKSKRFCSCVCSRSYSSSKRDKSNHSHNSRSFDKKRLLLAKNIKKNSGMIGRENSFTTRSETANKSFEWGPYLDKENAIAAPVCCFKHCYSNDFWQSVIINMKVEILNLDTNYTEDKAYWFATIKHVAGYFVKVRFEGYDDDGSNDLWVHLCSEAVNPVGWCAINGKRIIPPLSIESKYNWREYLLNALTGTFTLPYDFRQRVIDCNKSWPLVPGLQVEVVNKMCLSSTKVATIEENKGGRLKLRYNDSEGIDSYFWCHCLSSLIHPVGWSSLVGHNIEAAPKSPPPPISPPPSGVAAQLFSHLASRQQQQQSRFVPGMKLEAVDPLNLGSICAATVDKVTTTKFHNSSHTNSQQQLQNNSFCFDARSPYILPVGFCKINNIELTPPRGHKLPFDWYDYLQETRSVAAPVELFNQTVPKHGYRVGMKVEAVDLMDPKLICVATITTIVGRLMKIHFDGWEVLYDQWVDCQSPDIYPIGWCQLFNHRLEAPRINNNKDNSSNIGDAKSSNKLLYTSIKNSLSFKSDSNVSLKSDFSNSDLKKTVDEKLLNDHLKVISS
ncbi:hypothetical protein HELRODRAFT_77216, partial [Helobdella robusta]|uniref:FCS-type domain-containing protein n=1 Tax=Helobdella robusta TaxID=6412 RepID=T1G2U5_HELRO